MIGTAEEEFIDVRKIIFRAKDNWYYFVISVIVCVGMAVIYLKTAAKQYEVEATLQLKDQGLSNAGSGPEEFIQGLNLLSGDAELADEIGLLSSYSTVRRALEELDFSVSYFRYPDIWNPLAEQMEEELYRPGFTVAYYPERVQLVGVPIYISFPDTAHYRIRVEAEEAVLFDMQSGQVVQENVAATIDTTLPLDKPYKSDVLSLQILLDSNYVVQKDQQFYVKLNSLSSLTKAYANKLMIEPIADESSIVKLKTKGRVLQREKDFLNTLARVYIQHDIRKKNQLGVRAIEFIDAQLTEIYDSLQAVEGNLESFRSSNQIINISTTSASLNEQLQELEAEQAKLKVQKQYYEYTSQYLRNNEALTDMVAPSSVGIEDPLLNNLLKNLSELSQEKVEKSYSSGEDNPVLRVLENKISNTKAALIENIENLIGSNRIAVQENQRRINQLEAQLNRLPESERNLINIERKFALNDNIYNYLLEKRAEAGIAIASNLPNKSIIDEARSASEGPVSPNSRTVLVMALLAGLALPIGIIWTKYFFANRVISRSDLAEIKDVPLVGMVPQATKKQKLVARNTLIAESFRSLRVGINQRLQSTHPVVVGVTSAQAQDGKTFCASNLAMVYAYAQKKTLLIEADMRKPRLHEYFESNRAGLAEYLENRASLATLIRLSKFNNLSILHAGHPIVDAGVLLESDRFAQLVDEVKKNFDAIIIDAPPVGIVADYWSIGALVPLSLFVVRQNHTALNLVKGNLAKLTLSHPTAMVLNSAEGFVMSEYGYQNSKKSSYYTSTS